MKKITILLMLFLATSIFADQFQMNEKPVSLKAATVIKAQPEIGFFCAPCGDKMVTVVPVQNVTLKKSNSGGREYFTVKVNGGEIDLAYTYIKNRDGWKNLAFSLGLKPVEVPMMIRFPPNNGNQQAPKKNTIDGIEIEE